MDVEKQEFLTDGFTKFSRIISKKTVEELRVFYDVLLNDKEKTAGLRSDLFGGDTKSGGVEKITQIMCPSSILPELIENKVYVRALSWAKKLLGNDMELDFDMLINKAPNTNAPTPWHQDAAYWINLPDKRSVSCWIALDDVYKNNGCMWFIPKSNDYEVKPHQALPNGGALFCEANMEQGEAVPLSAGGCTFHDGFTLHYSHGNSTNSQRRALILNFRPQKMIALERAEGVNHTGERSFKNKKND